MIFLKYSRSKIPDSIANKSLENEANVETSHDLKFEISKTDATNSLNSDNVLSPESPSFNPGKTKNIRITFKIRGIDDQDFFLRGCTIR